VNNLKGYYNNKHIKDDINILIRRHTLSVCYLTNDNCYIQVDGNYSEASIVNRTLSVVTLYNNNSNNKENNTSIFTMQSSVIITTNNDISIIESNTYDDNTSSTSALTTIHNNHSHRLHNVSNNSHQDIICTPNVTTTVSIPTIRELMILGFPILGIWLLQPILSLVDSSILGLSPSVTVSELASLGPGIGFIDSTLYMFQFLGIGELIWMLDEW